MDDLIRIYELKIRETSKEYDEKNQDTKQETKILNAIHTSGKIHGLLEAIEIISLDDFVRIHDDINIKIYELLNISNDIYKLGGL